MCTACFTVSMWIFNVLFSGEYYVAPVALMQWSELQLEAQARTCPDKNYIMKDCRAYTISLSSEQSYISLPRTLRSLQEWSQLYIKFVFKHDTEIKWWNGREEDKGDLLQKGIKRSRNSGTVWRQLLWNIQANISTHTRCILLNNSIDVAEGTLNICLE